MAHNISAGAAGGYCERFHQAIELIGLRWTGAILLALRSGRARFCEIRESVPGLSDRMLSERLRELEAAGLVERRVAPTIPVQVRYRLTAKGLDLGGVIDEVSRWAERWVDAGDRGGARVRAAVPAGR